MRFEAYSFGSIRIDGVTYEHDVVIDRGQVRKRKKKPSKKFRDAFGHNSAIHRGGNTLEVPATHRRYRNGTIADHERCKARSRAPQDRIARASDNQSDSRH